MISYNDYHSCAIGADGLISDQSCNATVTVATISTLLVLVVLMVGVYFAVQIGYKLATRKRRYCFQNL